MVGRWRTVVAAVIAVIACAGCRSLLGIDDPTRAIDGPLLADAAIDAGRDGATADVGSGAATCPVDGLDPCSLSASALTSLGALPLTGDGTYDTGTCAGGTQLDGLCVLHLAGGVTIDKTFHATGSAPLVLAAEGSLTIAGTLDVSTVFGTTVLAAAGENGSACHAPTPASFAGAVGGGGGAGGSFATAGGNGGNAGGAGGTGGAAGPADASVPATVRGGCGGGIGASSNTPPGSRRTAAARSGSRRPAI